MSLHLLMGTNQCVQEVDLLLLDAVLACLRKLEDPQILKCRVTGSWVWEGCLTRKVAWLPFPSLGSGRCV